MLGLTIVGCAAPESTSRAEAIIGAAGPDGRFDGVVMLYDPLAPDGRVGVCSGTLISPSHVLTAAHCGDATYAVTGTEAMTWSTDPFGNVMPFVRLTADVARSVAFCRVHPALRRDAAEVDGDCARRDLASGPYDVAVVVLREPVPPEWATHAAALRIRRNFHRILDHDEVPFVGERVAHVGYGLNVSRDDWRSVPGHVTSIGTRRAVDRAIVGIDARPDFAVVATGIEMGGSGSSGGDSGGPMLWLDAAPHPLWGQPPVALHSEAPEGEAGQRGTYLGTPETSSLGPSTATAMVASTRGARRTPSTRRPTSTRMATAGSMASTRPRRPRTTATPTGTSTTRTMRPTTTTLARRTATTTASGIAATTAPRMPTPTRPIGTRMASATPAIAAPTPSRRGSTRTWARGSISTRATRSPTESRTSATSAPSSTTPTRATATSTPSWWCELARPRWACPRRSARRSAATPAIPRRVARRRWAAR